MRDIIISLFLITIGYWANYFLHSLNIGFALTIVSFAIPTVLYFLNNPNVDRKSYPDLRK